jgi:hypothetical protein
MTSHILYLVIKLLKRVEAEESFLRTKRLRKKKSSEIALT